MSRVAVLILTIALPRPGHGDLDWRAAGDAIAPSDWRLRRVALGRRPVPRDDRARRPRGQRARRRSGRLDRAGRRPTGPLGSGPSSGGRVSTVDRGYDGLDRRTPGCLGRQPYGAGPCGLEWLRKPSTGRWLRPQYPDQNRLWERRGPSRAGARAGAAALGPGRFRKKHAPTVGEGYRQELDVRVHPVLGPTERSRLDQQARTPLAGMASPLVDRAGAVVLEHPRRWPRTALLAIPSFLP